MNPDNPKSEEIIEVASILFSQNGYDATSLQEIADRVGLHKTSLFHYFKNKEEILMEVMDRSIREYIDILDDDVFNPELPPEKKLRLALERQIRVICKYKNYINVYLTEIRSLSPENRERYNRKRKQYGINFEKVIREIQNDERCRLFKGIDSKAVTMGILGMCNWMIKWYKPDGDLTPREISDIFCRLLTDRRSELHAV